MAKKTGTAEIKAVAKAGTKAAVKVTEAKAAAVKAETKAAAKATVAKAATTATRASFSASLPYG